MQINKNIYFIVVNFLIRVNVLIRNAKVGGKGRAAPDANGQSRRGSKHVKWVSDARTHRYIAPVHRRPHLLPVRTYVDFRSM